MNIVNQQNNIGGMSILTAVSNKRWYVMRVKSGKESQVKEYIDTMLSRSADLAKCVSQVLVPMEKVCVARKDKKIIKNKPFYSGYIFIEAVLNGATISALRCVPNVYNFLSYDRTDNKPKPMTRQEVEGLLRTVGELCNIEVKSADVFNVGESVKVKEGPFCGFNAVVESLNNEKLILNVVVRIFGRNTPMVLSFSQVEKQ